MKSALLLFLMLLCSNIFWAQTQKSVTPAVTVQNIEHYKIDFEVVGFSNGIDTAYVNSLSLSEFEHNRKKEEDVTIYDLNTGYSIILYSYEKVQIRKSEVQDSKSHQLNFTKSKRTSRHIYLFGIKIQVFNKK
jgi:hypothetical protein